MTKLGKLLFVLVCTLTSLAFAQEGSNPPPTAGYVQYQGFAPSGPCTLPNYLIVDTQGTQAGLYQCKGVPLTWQAIAPTSAIAPADGITQLTGDVTAGPGTSVQVATLATVITPTGPCGDANHVCRVTYDAKGRILSATSTAITGVAGNPGGSSGQGQWNSSASFAGYTTSGDCTQNFSTGVITCTKTNNVSFATSATTDTTNASNINSGTLNVARLPAFSGDVSTNAGSTVTTLATVNGAPGSCGDATHVCQTTTNAKGLTTSQTAVAITAATVPLYLEWTFNNGTAVSDAAPIFQVSHAGTIAACVVTTTTSDGATALTLNILDNGTTIFSGGAQTVSAGTTRTTATTLGSLATTSFAANDQISFNITSGSSSWVFSVLCK